MIRRPPRSTQSRSSAASDVYKRQIGLLTDQQWTRVSRLFDTDEHAEVEITWAAYQRMITAYREPDRAAAKHDFANLIASLRTGVPAALIELRRLGRTLNARASDILAFFDRPGTSNGPTEAIKGLSLIHISEPTRRTPI